MLSRLAILMIAVASFAELFGLARPSFGQSATAPQEPAIPTRPIAVERERSWEYDPYRVCVWLVDDDSFLFRQFRERIKNRIDRDAKLDEFSGWHVTCDGDSSAWKAWLFASWDSDASQWSKRLAAELDLSQKTLDKLILVRVAKVVDGFSVEARELDIKTQQVSGVTKLRAATPECLPAQAFAAMRRSFMPLVRVDRVANENVYVRLRASALNQKLGQDGDQGWVEVPNPNSPICVRDDDVFLPVIRREGQNNRPASVDTVKWTFLTVQERTDTTLKCLIQTTQFAPLSGRSGTAIKKLGVAVRAEPAPTTVYVSSEESKSQAPLTGLEIYTCRPEDLPRKDGPKKEYTLLGKTDWRGAIVVPPEPDGSIVYIIIRNGQLATKLPVLPGWQDRVNASVFSDRARLFAEGIVNGLISNIIDVANQRAALKARIELALEQKRFERAEKLLNDEYLKLPTMRELSIQVAQTEERMLSRKDADSRQRDRIQKMFDNIRKGIGAKLVDKDETELIDRVLNKISAPREAPPIPEGDTEVPFEPNKPAEKAATGDSAETNQ